MRALLIVVALGAVARAEMPARVSVAGDGTCPTATAVGRALERLHPTLRTDGGVAVAIVDRGATYEVRADQRSRTLDDPARRCAERATAAAVAITLLLDPPAAPPPPEEPSGPLAPRETPESAATTTPPTTTRTTAPPRATPTPMAATAAAPAVVAPTVVAPIAAASSTLARRAAASSAATAPRRPSRIDLELVGLVDGAPALAGAASEVTGGAALRLSVGGRYVAATLGISGLAPATATSSSVDVTVVRVPFDAGVRLLFPAGRVEPGIDVGLAFAILQLSAPALTGATTNTRLDVAARIAPLLRIGLTARLALTLGVQIGVSFAPYDLVVNGPGKIGTTPRLWLGGGLGLAARL